MGRFCLLLALMLGLACSWAALAQDMVLAQDKAPAAAPAPEVAPGIPAAAVAAVEAPVPAAPEGMRPPKNVTALTLQEMITHGGMFLWILMALGFIALVMSLYFTFTLTVRREAPKALVKRVHAQIADGDFRGAYQMCAERDEYLANVLRAGLKHAGHDRFVLQEAMESEGERGATSLWQRISWLNSIATMAPLLGLLGTVWGMMSAFRAIAFDDAQARGMAMAYAVSEAMVTTAAGLMLAIPCMAVYYFLRSRVIRIIAEVEAQATETVELMSEVPAAPAPRPKPELFVREGRR